MVYYPDLKYERLKKILSAKFPSLDLDVVRKSCEDILKFDDSTNSISKR
jgi:hypothetical protein